MLNAMTGVLRLGPAKPETVEGFWGNEEEEEEEGGCIQSGVGRASVNAQRI